MRDDSTLLAFLRKEFEASKDTTFDERRRICMERYKGEPFGNEVSGRSALVTRDVMEKCDYMAVSVMDTVISGERIVDFESEDESQAETLKLAGRVIHENFFRKQNGFQLVDDCLKSGLVEILGVAMAYYEIEIKKERQPLASEDDLAMLMAEGIEAEVEETEQGLEAVWSTKKYRFHNCFIPLNELFVARDARTIQSSRYTCHLTERSISELRAQGYDVDDNVGDDGDRQTRESARDSGTNFQKQDRTGPERTVRVYHEFVRYDYDGDGLSELRQIIRVGSTILHNEEVDFSLIEEWCPFPMAGRRIGESLAEKLIDIEKARSFLLRETIDNYALSNRPRVLVGERSERVNGVTLDDLLNHEVGHPIRYASEAPQALAIPFTAGNAFEGLEFLAGEAETYSGITRLNQGLDRDALNKTATGTAMMQAQGQQMELYVARQFAEFLARLFALNYRLLQIYGEPQIVMLDGQPKEVDPKTWPDVFTVTPRTGLGSGKKEARAQARMQLLEVQQQGLMAGLPISPDHLFYNVNGLVQDLGLGEGRNYWPNGEEAAQQPPKPDPEMQKVELEKQKAQAKLEADMMKAEQDQMMAQQKAQTDLDLAREKAALEAELARDKAAAELELERERMANELVLERERMAMEHELEKQRMALQVPLDAVRLDNDRQIGMEKAKMSKNRSGGDLTK